MNDDRRFQFQLLQEENTRLSADIDVLRQDCADKDASLDIAVAALVAERDRAHALSRDVTSLRAELASIAIMLQERHAIDDLGGRNLVLVASAVLVYVMGLERQRDAERALSDALAAALETLCNEPTHPYIDEWYNVRKASQAALAAHRSARAGGES
jgi:chromosome condensin MukBEF ATPase and DNA-binding subunit MukB